MRASIDTGLLGLATMKSIGSGKPRSEDLNLAFQMSHHIELKKSNTLQMSNMALNYENHMEAMGVLQDGFGEIISETKVGNRLQEYQNRITLAGFQAVEGAVKTANEEIKSAIEEGTSQIVEATYRSAEVINNSIKDLNQTTQEVKNILNEQLNMTNSLLSDSVWTAQNRYLVESMETERAGKNYLRQYMFDGKKSTQNKAYECFQRAVSQDNFNVSAILNLNDLEIQMNKDSWLRNYRDLFNKIETELMNEDNKRKDIAINIAKRLSVTHSINLFGMAEYNDFLHLYDFAKEHSIPDFHIILDVFKTISIYATSIEEEGNQFFILSAKKWGLDRFSDILLRQNAAFIHMDPIKNYANMHRDYITKVVKLAEEQDKCFNKKSEKLDSLLQSFNEHLIDKND